MRARDSVAEFRQAGPASEPARSSIVIRHVSAADAARLLMDPAGTTVATSVTPPGGIVIVHLSHLNVDLLAQLSRLKAVAGCSRCIVVMAEGGDDEQVAALGAGADDVIVGPCSATLLNARIVKQKVELERDLSAVACSRQLAKRLEKMRALALHDPLTGLANRRAFDHALRREWARNLRHQRALGIIMIDVDHFKRYNDSRGHPQGDLALRRIGACLRDEIKRETDVVARYGGEEFICLVSEIDVANALALAERIRAAVESLGLEYCPQARTRVLTASLGVTIATPASGLDAQSALVRADRALYQAKRAGRNQVVLSNSAPDHPAVTFRAPAALNKDCAGG